MRVEMWLWSGRGLSPGQVRVLVERNARADVLTTFVRVVDGTRRRLADTLRRPSG
jgi:hypothetical protein